ncbi:hypothetical protein ACHQM5_009037 [Ranunculus cassubicifolius]
MPSTGGSRILEGYRPAFDATAVKKIRECGAVLVGKTNMDEFGMGSTTEASGFQILKTRKSLLSRERKAVEIAEEYLNRLRKTEPQIRSFLHVSENVIKEAEEIDRKIENNEEVGILAGVLVGVKDNICTVDMPSTGGF